MAFQAGWGQLAVTMLADAGADGLKQHWGNAPRTPRGARPPSNRSSRSAALYHPLDVLRRRR
eukprot:7935068-Alexandrium_andersonii.AAC.1